MLICFRHDYACTICYLTLASNNKPFYDSNCLKKMSEIFLISPEFTNNMLFKNMEDAFIDFGVIMSKFKVFLETIFLKYTLYFIEDFKHQCHTRLIIKDKSRMLVSIKTISFKKLLHHCWIDKLLRIIYPKGKFLD